MRANKLSLKGGRIGEIRGERRSAGGKGYSK